MEKCDLCDASDWRTAHSASLLTDLNTAKNKTCWVSEPTSDNTQNVTLTLSLGKRFELTYISLLFCAKIPDSMSLYKSTNFGKTWTPFQFFSTDCQKTYQRNPNVTIGRHNEQVGFLFFEVIFGKINIKIFQVKLFSGSALQ